MRRDEKRKQTERSSIDRRRLLSGAGFAIGAAGACAVVGAAPATACESEKPGHKGYRESEDVKTYYRLARL
ncbi:MAG TPA: hypothetical protein VFT69_05740 [Pseudolabrys sp.]|jgi:hypothetical protein|nr:hypothetical protein [Pseudolabrys sp.]